ncbi:hypothetical protein Y1Q_0021121 [Alligator mississippiensis]|uniref:Uncharacterized protein n=1 Tax=Alligator mississippiensis TaxID=8496 RepID=A0A151NRS0_ALLMI|nr:hypothetical protein Y1Q_0021121 [Alligator mississippiensis]
MFFCCKNCKSILKRSQKEGKTPNYSGRLNDKPTPYNRSAGKQKVENRRNPSTALSLSRGKECETYEM